MGFRSSPVMMFGVCTIAIGALLLPWSEVLIGQERKKAKDKVPLGLPARIWPADNPYSVEKELLGRHLFYDKRLSGDGTVACATCHDPNHAFTDGRDVSIGIRNQAGKRSAPTIINRAYSKEQFWDGRAPSLEAQVEGPLRSPLEMDNTPENCVKTLERVPEYGPLFERAFGSPEISFPRITLSIATFERTILSGNSPYDRFKAGDRNALSPRARRGERVFFKKAKCDQCHFGSNFTDGGFANVGIGMNRLDPDLGRHTVMGRPMDWGAFKIPTLREIEHTAPYMHDGSLKSLEDVVEHYNRGGIPNPNLDRRYRALGLSNEEKADLVEFLKSLSGEGWQHLVAPDSRTRDNQPE